MTLSDERIQEIAKEAASDAIVEGNDHKLKDFIESAIRQAVAESHAWKPIEAAPTDGTEFVGLRWLKGNWKVGFCHRVQRNDCEMWVFSESSAAHHNFPWHRPQFWKPKEALGPLPQPPETPK